MKINKGIKWGCLAPIAFVILGVITLFFIDAFVPSNSKKSLPSSATNVQEYYEGWNDFVRLIKADMNKQDYELYASELELTEQYEPLKHEDIKSMLNMGIGDAPAWWNPPNASEATYFKYTKGDGYLQVLHYNQGTAYFMVSAW